jgi:hypothetical protein
MEPSSLQQRDFRTDGFETEANPADIFENVGIPPDLIEDFFAIN